VIRRRVIVGATFIMLFVLGWWAGRGGAAGGLYGNLDLFIEVMNKVDQNYVDPPDTHKMMAGALRGMLRELDPYSQYLDARAFGGLRSATEGAFGGIGAVVGIRDNYPTVISPIEGSPAWDAGVRSGDVIVRIGGQSTAGLAVEEIGDRLRGPAGSTVDLAIDREGESDEITLTLTRAIIHSKSVPYAFLAEPGIGYLRLSSVTESSGDEVRAALAALRRQGARAFVFDLRRDPGGLLDQAVDVAEQFLPRGALVVSTRGCTHGSEVRYNAADPAPDVNSPLVVLVDEGSASAAEIIAGALQDLDRAPVLGHVSFGKGSVQTVFPLGEGSGAVKLTTALYHTPSGRSIHRFTGTADPDAEDADPADSAGVAAADSASRPVFHTARGRVVRGGGGITPDLAVEPDSLPPYAREVESRGRAFAFVTRWLNTHPGSPGVDDAMRAEFTRWLRDDQKLSGAPTAADLPLLDRALRRERARRLAGDAGAARVSLESDAVAQRALALLRGRRSVREVFAALPAAGAAH
jgi:carboxyl-terminal processing protease